MNNAKKLLGAYLEMSDSTKKEVAEKLGMSTDAFRMKMNGSTEFTLSQAKKLAEILRCTIDDLFD